MVAYIFQEAPNILTCSISFFKGLRGAPNQCIPVIELMEEGDNISPINIYVVGCRIIPKEFPVVLAWISVYLLLKESSYEEHDILMLHILQRQIDLHGSF